MIKMSSPYLIEFRFHGYAKRYLKSLIFDVSRKFRVRTVTRKRVVPHVTLFGPFSTRDENKVLSTIVSVCSNYELVPFKLRGFGNFGNEVIYVDIEPSEQLKNLRRELTHSLTGLRSFFFMKTVPQTKVFDRDEEFNFHATVAFKDIGYKFDRIWNYLKHKRPPDINQYLLRVTLLKKSKILYEYDLLQKRPLTRTEAKKKEIFRKTVQILKSRIYQER